MLLTWAVEGGGGSLFPSSALEGTQARSLFSLIREGVLPWGSDGNLAAIFKGYEKDHQRASALHPHEARRRGARLKDVG